TIKFRNRILKPQTVINLNWNNDIKKRAILIEKNLFFSECTSKKDFLILKILQLMGKDEESFLYIQPKTQKAGLLFDIQKNIYLGFIVWTDKSLKNKKYAILRQIFITNEERRKGYGTKLLKFWIKTFADKINERYCIESPNKLSQKMLISLGHAKIEGQYIKAGKCFFI
ncbi:GNAT family N-acetyltransferase, partial [archaeon]|nr:GNAT family N-acetyltransferase [archaeon]